jgi:membrane-bound serine protease (ClpP class)
MKLTRIKLFIFFFLFLLLCNSIAASQSTVLVVEMNDTIDRATVEILSEAIQEAERQSHDVIILTLYTPGGGLQETFEIADIIENSSLPIVGYVYPKGAYAWSAGTFILMSAHIAAMADNTIIGSCQPVEISIEGTRPINDSKTINALVSWLQERAAIHKRNTTLVKEFITQNRNINASIALQEGVIEYSANSINELLDRIDGANITTSEGSITLHTANATVQYFSPSFQVEFIKFISNPILTSLLFMIGIFALIFGLSSPGFGAEVFGVIAILISLIGSGFSISELSLIFLAIGGILLFIELFVTPGFGVIGVGGMICFIVGSIFLIPTYSSREWVIAMSWIDNLILIIIITGILVSIFFVFLLYKILEIRKKKKAVGEFKGEIAKTIDALTPNEAGYIRFKGELWQAQSEKAIEKNKKVKIIKKDGSLLIVKPSDGNTKH